MAKELGSYSPILIREFYAAYAATLLNVVTEGGSKKKKRAAATKLDPISQVQVRGVQVQISEETIMRFLYGPTFDAIIRTRYYEHLHHATADEERMRNPTRRSKTQKWVAETIALEGENAPWVANSQQTITKASLKFAAKFWWAVVRSRLWPTTNDNTLHPTQAALVASIMARKGIHSGRLICTEMRDRALNERAAFPFPCLVQALCDAAKVQMNRHFDQRTTCKRTTTAAKIKDFDNPLFKSK